MSTRDAVIVSTARTPIGRAYKGAFNATPGPTLGAFSLKPAIERAGIDAGEIDDVVWGAVLTQGTQFGNIGRQVALRAGCPVGVSGMTIDRQCSSGLMAIATAAKQIIIDRMDVVAAGGQDSISMVQTPEMRIAPDPSLIAMHQHVYMPMLQTAETVARRYGIARERQDEYALKSQQRTAAAQAAGRFDDEIVPVTTTMMVKDKETGEVSQKEVTIAKDEGNRADTTLEGLVGPQPRARPRHVDHRRQCQPAVRRQLGVDPDGSRRKPSAAGSRRWAATSAWRSPAPSPTRWASARSTRSTSCSSASTSRSTTSACGN